MRLEEELANIQRHLARVQSSGAFDQVRAAQRILNSIAVPPPQVVEAMIRAQRVFASVLQQIKFPDFDGWIRTEREATAILTARGWWPHPEWPVGVLDTVLQLKREGRIRQLDSLICASYEANRCRPMRHALDRWMSVPEFKARRRIFSDGLWAHRRRKYGLAVTHWLPQVEGILRALAERQGLTQGGWKRAGRGLTQAQPDYMDSFMQAFFDAWHSMYADSLPRGRTLPKRPAFPVQRDAILHGIDLKFGRRAYAMRVFLMLDTLQYLIAGYEKAGTKAA